ncbi:MAG: ASKHA domain-containing protein [Thermofilum sp.]
MEDSTVVVEPYGLKLPVKGCRTLYEIFQAAGIPLRSDCGGRGFCGKCRVVLRVEGETSQPTQPEMKHLTAEELARSYRLACQVRVCGSAVAYLPPESRAGLFKVASRGFSRRVPPKPLVRKVRVELHPPGLRDVLADWERLRFSLAKRTGLELDLDPEVLAKLPAVLRDSGWIVDAAIWRGRLVVGVEKPLDGEYGLAVDIGTTKLVVHLVDLSSGEPVAEAKAENPQVLVGEDIVARLSYALRGPEGLRRLQELVVSALNNLASAVLAESGIPEESLLGTVIVGNTVMHHLVLGLDVRGLAFSPYVPVVRGTVEVPAERLGLKHGRRALFPPVIAGYVGSDAVADIIATGIHLEREPSLLIDIGTNTEVVLSTGEELLACSAPSGPAFEGAHMKHGMKASVGAIERISLRDGDVKYTVIGDVRPIGLCGSAYIDFAAEALRAGILDERGFFKRDVPNARLRKGRQGYEYVVVPAGESGRGSEITISEGDLSELRLAKAAVYSAVKVLLEETQLSPSDVEKVYLCGSFGYGINVENAVAVGLLPPLEPSRVFQAGNTAIEGARLILISEDVLAEAEKAAERTRYVELAAAPSFPRFFREGLTFPKLHR